MEDMVRTNSDAFCRLQVLLCWVVGMIVQNAVGMLLTVCAIACLVLLLLQNVF